MRTVAECDRRIAELQQRIRQAEADRDLKTARENKETRRLRTRALVILGGEVLRATGLDWTQIDPDRFGRLCDDIAGTITRECQTTAIEPKEAIGRYDQRQMDTRNSY